MSEDNIDKMSSDEQCVYVIRLLERGVRALERISEEGIVIDDIASGAIESLKEVVE